MQQQCVKPTNRIISISFNVDTEATMTVRQDDRNRRRRYNDHHVSMLFRWIITLILSILIQFNLIQSTLKNLVSCYHVTRITSTNINSLTGCWNTIQKNGGAVSFLSPQHQQQKRQQQQSILERRRQTTCKTLFRQRHNSVFSLSSSSLRSSTRTDDINDATTQSESTTLDHNEEDNKLSSVDKSSINYNENMIMNITILLTRESGKNDKIRKAIEKKWNNENMIHSYSSTDIDIPYRINIMEIPCIEHTDGDDYNILKSTILQQPQWDYIIVTSPEAASVLLSQWPYKTKDEVYNHKIVAVGVATEQVLRAGGISVDFVPTKATAQTLIHELPFISSSNSSTGVCHVLYPASARAENTIQNGLQIIRSEINPNEIFHVKRLNTYDTITSIWNYKQQEQVLSWLSSSSDQQQHKNHVIVTVGSPSSLNGWLLNTNNCTNVNVACIGETSQKECLKYGWDNTNIYYPIDKPGIDGWMKSIEHAVHDVIIASSKTTS